MRRTLSRPEARARSNTRALAGRPSRAGRPSVTSLGTRRGGHGDGGHGVVAATAKTVTVSWRSRRRRSRCHGGRVATAVTSPRRSRRRDGARKPMLRWRGGGESLGASLKTSLPPPRSRRRCRHKAAAAAGTRPPLPKRCCCCCCPSKASSSLSKKAALLDRSRNERDGHWVFDGGGRFRI